MNLRQYEPLFLPVALTATALTLPGLVLFVLPGPWWILGLLLMTPLVLIITGILTIAFLTIWKDALRETRHRRKISQPPH